jgi:hypothetical protein
MSTYAYVDYKGFSVISPTPPGLPAQTVDANFKIVADALANSPAGVAHVSPNGSDSTGNGSFYRPFLTLQKAFSLLAAGDFTAIKLGPGSFGQANLTVGANTPTSWSLLGSGMWSSAVAGISINATASHAGMNIHFRDLKSSEGATASPAIAIETSSAIGYFHLDVSDVYLSRAGGAATEVVKAYGTSPSNEPLALRLCGLSHVRATGSGQNCVDIGHGQFQMIGGGMWSTSGNEIKAKSGATAIQLNGVLLGSMAGIGKSNALIAIENSGTGLQVMLSSLVTTMGTGHLIDAASGAQILAFLDCIAAIRGGTGGVSVPTGIVIYGNTIDASSGAELPITAYQQINLKKALSTAFLPTTSGNWTGSPTTVQAALDELAGRVYTLEHP